MSRRGFTLTELLVATIVFLVGFGSVFPLFRATFYRQLELRGTRDIGDGTVLLHFKVLPQAVA